MWTYLSDQISSCQMVQGTMFCKWICDPSKKDYVPPSDPTVKSMFYRIKNMPFNRLFPHNHVAWCLLQDDSASPGTKVLVDFRYYHLLWEQTCFWLPVFYNSIPTPPKKTSKIYCRQLVGLRCFGKICWFGRLVCYSSLCDVYLTINFDYPWFLYKRVMLVAHHMDEHSELLCFSTNAIRSAFVLERPALWAP